MEIKEDSILIKSDDLIEANLGESLALMSIDSGKYFGMNHVGKHIWTALDQEISFRELVDSLVKTFNVDEDTCKDHCRIFLSELLEKNLISMK